MTSRAAELVRVLGLEPHPEGGHYREVFRSTSGVWPTDERPLRAALTTIYFLLDDGEVSRWHRVRSDEVWHLYEGGTLELLVAPPDLSSVERRRVTSAGEGPTPVSAVPAGWWQAARPLGGYVLAGCTVGPGFEFADFTFLRDAAEAVEALRACGRLEDLELL
jgi:predicted cupin superfamily sugar epimerase